MNHLPNDDNTKSTTNSSSIRSSLLSKRSSNDSKDSLTIPKSIFADDYKKENHRWSRRRNLPQYTTEEISKHNTKDSCWIIVDSLVLDVTKFLPYHPANSAAILKYSGTFC